MLAVRPPCTHTPVRTHALTHTQTHPQGNHLGSKGLALITLGLKRNKTLQVLDLTMNQIGNVRSCNHPTNAFSLSLSHTHTHFHRCKCHD